MTQEFIKDCLCILNEAIPVDECLDYDDDSKEFVRMYFVDIADPNGMNGISTKVHEMCRYSEDEMYNVMLQVCKDLYDGDSIAASCLYQFEIPQEAWDICDIEELDYQFEIEWELSNEESYWDPFEDYVPW